MQNHEQISNALVLNASTVTGTLDVLTNGTITSPNALLVTGAATFAAGAANDITLNSNSNNFTSLGVTSGKDVILVDANDFALGASSISGNLTLTSLAGNITDVGSANVAGNASFIAATANGTINLDQASTFRQPG